MLAATNGEVEVPTKRLTVAQRAPGRGDPSPLREREEAFFDLPGVWPSWRATQALGVSELAPGEFVGALGVPSGFVVAGSR